VSKLIETITLGHPKDHPLKVAIVHTQEYPTAMLSCLPSATHPSQFPLEQKQLTDLRKICGIILLVISFVLAVAYSDVTDAVTKI